MAAGFPAAVGRIFLHCRNSMQVRRPTACLHPVSVCLRRACRPGYAALRAVFVTSGPRLRAREGIGFVGRCIACPTGNGPGLPHWPPGPAPNRHPERPLRHPGPDPGSSSGSPGAGRRSGPARTAAAGANGQGWTPDRVRGDGAGPSSPRFDTADAHSDCFTASFAGTTRGGKGPRSKDSRHAADEPERDVCMR